MSKVWEELIPWHNDISTAWSKPSDTSPTKKPRLDINALSKIEVTASFDRQYTGKEAENFVQTGCILGTFLLMVGKRSDGRRVLLDLVKLIITEEMLIDDSQQIELLLELSQAAWLDGALNDLLTQEIIEHIHQIGQRLNKDSKLYQQYKIALCIIGSGKCCELLHEKLQSDFCIRSSVIILVLNFYKRPEKTRQNGNGSFNRLRIKGF